MSQIEFANLQEAVISLAGPMLEFVFGLVMVLSVALSIIHLVGKPQHGSR